MPKRTSKDKACGSYIEKSSAPSTDATPRIPMLSSLFLALCAALLSLSIPLAVINSSVLLPISVSVMETGLPYFYPILMAACVVAAVAVVFISRKIFTLITVGLLFTLIIPAVKDVGLLAAILGFTVGSGILSTLFTVEAGARMIIPSAVPFISYPVALLLTGTPVIALLSLSPVIPSLAMGIATRRKKGSASSISAYAIFFALQSLLALAAFLMIKHRAISFEIVAEEMSHVKSVLVTLAESAIERSGKVELNASLSREISALANIAINSAVGLFATAALFAGFISHRIKYAALELYSFDELIECAGKIKASITASAIFAVSYVLTFTSGAAAGPSFVAVVAQNLCLIFFPVLFLSGADAVIGLPRRIGILAVGAWIGVILFSSLSGSSIITVVALVGAIVTLISGIDRWAEQHYSKGE